MNKVTSVNVLCRSAFSGLELLDLGGNKVVELPIALIHFLKGLCQLTLTNNDINRLPHLIGFHKNIRNIQVDGNPLKSIRRAIIDKGSQGIVQYLMDKYVEEYDNKVE
jgi:Leucine-rich repeat (LRR) protein